MPELRPTNAHTWARDGLDWYVEERRASEQLFAVERFVGEIADPCCGQGNIVLSAHEAGYHAYGSDVVRRVDAEWFWKEHDFFSDAPFQASNIVSNPPFFRGKGAEAFIRKALETATHKVAVFVSIGFLAGAGRAAGLFRDHPPHRVWIVTPRVSCPPGEWLSAGNKAGGGKDDWCWLVYDRLSPWRGTDTGWLTR